MNSNNEDWDDWDSDDEKLYPIARKKSVDDNRIGKIVQQFKDFFIELTDELVREKINKSLDHLEFDLFINYYVKNVSLSNYTIEREMSRMKFEVFHQSILYKGKEDILSIFEKESQSLLWRFANQSIYAEIVNAIQVHFPIQELHISVTSTSTLFQINFDSNSLYTESIFAFQIPSATTNQKIKIADIIGVVEVFLDTRILKQYLKSLSLQVIFDAQLRLVRDTYSFNTIE